MNLLNTLTIKNLKLNKKRTIVTIIGIILSVALITSLATMYTSFIASAIKSDIYYNGNFHVAFYSVSKDDIGIFTNNKAIDTINIVRDEGYADLDLENAYKPYAHIFGFTKSSMENLSIRLVDGRLPEKENEILISERLKIDTKINYKIGDEITLNIGNRVLDEEILNKNNIYNTREELLQIKSKTYKVVGIIKPISTAIEPTSDPAVTFITYISEDLSGNVDLYIRYNKKNIKDNFELTTSILEVEANDYKVNNNTLGYSGNLYRSYELLNKIEGIKYKTLQHTTLISLENNPLLNSSVKELGEIALVICLIIMWTSILCIKNSFDISITEKNREYGMFRSIGATKKQIKKNVLYEALILGLIGIPLGIILGNLCTFILVKTTNILLKGSTLTVFSVSYFAIIISVILGMTTIYLSAIRSATKASRVSPIEAIRNNNDIKIDTKKIKSNKIINNIFGLGGDIAYKSMQRNNKKYRTTIISIALSVCIFITISTVMNIFYKEYKKNITVYDYNLSVSIEASETNIYDKALHIVSLDNIDNYAISRYISAEIENPNYTDEYMQYGMSENNYLGIISVGDKAYKDYLSKHNLDYDKVYDKGIIIGRTTRYYNDENNVSKNILLKEFDYKKNDIMIFTINKVGYEINIVDYYEDVPFSQDGYGTFLLVSDKLMDIYSPNISYLSIYIKSNNANELQTQIADYLDDDAYNIYNTSDELEEFQNTYTLIAIFAYSFITVISLIGVTNIFNTITTSMELRRKEFAMLKSVGMTNKEFSKMIRLESLFLGMKSLLIGISTGIFLSYIIYKVIDSLPNSNIKYTLSISSIFICILVVFILIIGLMKYSINKINKQNIIETIRNENI